ncbi:MAG: HDIG domain-containing protein, partial [bacterium]|nr:HDIG domain-containing protein [bacterium]
MKRQIIKGWKDFLGEIHRSDFSDLARFKESAAAGWAGFVLFCIAVTWLTSFSVSHLPENIRVGQLITRDIRADRSLSIVNQEETEKDRKMASISVLPVFDYDESVPSDAPEKILPLLLKPIISSKESLVPYLDTGIVLNRVHPPENIRADDKELAIKNVSKILTVEQAKAGLPKNLQKWIVPNTTFNLRETEARRLAAMRSVKEKTVNYQAGDFIVRARTKLEPKDVELLEMIKKTRGLENTPIRFLGTLLFVALAVGGTFYFSERFVKRFLPERKDYILMGLVVITILGILRVSLLLAGVIHEAFFYEIPRSALYYAIPISGGVMLVRMFLTAEVSLVLAVILSLLAGITVGSSVNYTTYCLISCIAAGSAIARADHRAAIMKAGFYTGLVNALAALGLHLLQIDRLESVFQWDALMAHLGFAMLGGLAAAVFVLVAAPIAEWLLDYTTDIKLLELGNLNHPLLKELVVRAPGTYHHSHMVGMLAEAAAEAVGANPLMARVSAYYHDIGKMKIPAYYTENDQAQENRHEQ